MIRSFISLLLAISCSVAMAAQDYTFRLKNTLALERTDETVEVTLPESLNPATCTLLTEGGTAVPFEVLADGHSIRFQASVKGTATAGFVVREGTPVAPTKRTYAAVKMPSNRADIAWENDLCAYRMYSSVLLASEKNTAQGVDVWFKKKAIPVIDEMYNLSNYHNESQYGVDAYSVNGKRLGCGGTAVVVNGALQMHDPYSTCEIVEQSALRSAFTLTYDDVTVNGQKYRKILHVETTAGALLNKATVRLEGPAATVKMAVGVYQHTDMNHLNEGVAFTEVPGLVGWAEAKSEGSITSAGARFYQGAYMPGKGVTTEVIGDHLCLTTDYAVGTDLTFYFGGGWNIFPAGRYASDDDWFDALTAFKQQVEAPLTLTSMTTLPQRDDVIHILNTVNQTWQERHPSHGDYFWNRAVYHIGNMEAYAATSEQQYLDYSTAWSKRNNWWGATGTDKSRWQYATYGEGANWVLFGDNQVCFQVYIDLYNLDDVKDPSKIERALEVMGYEISTPNEDYLWWVDGLFMVMPIMTKLYKVTGEQAYLDKMYAYWKYYTVRMFDTEEDLYYRDANYVFPNHTTLAGKKDFWARGDGWIFAAFAKVLQDLPESDAHRDEYISYYRRMAAALKRCQQAEGYWERSLIDPDQAPGYETSGTALFAYGYAWGINNGILDEVEYGETLERAWNYLANIALQENGTVGYIQPIGSKAIPGQVLYPTSYYDFGVGAFLMAAAEMSRFAVGSVGAARLRMASARMQEGRYITVTFNHQPKREEALVVENYAIDGEPIAADDITLDSEGCVHITLAEPLAYGRYVFSATGIHSAEGGEMADKQQCIIVRTVPLDEPQTTFSITSIGSQSGNPHTNVMDGKLETRWSQEGTNQWLQLNLRATRMVAAVDIAFYQGDTRVNYLNIQTSLSGSVWKSALGDVTSSGVTNELERYVFPEPVKARYVKIFFNGNSINKWNSITEVRVRFAETDGIESVDDVDMAGGSESDWYDLSGRKLSHSAVRKGVYIVNGKKVMVR